MNCNRCPYYVRHGYANKTNKEIIFFNICSIKLKKENNQNTYNDGKTTSKKQTTEDKLNNHDPRKSNSCACNHYPFSNDFQYSSCPIYQEHYAINNIKNQVLPSKEDFHFNKNSPFSVTDLEPL
jgi:hypothetical protein